MLTTLGLLRHYSSGPAAVNDRSHGLKSLAESEAFDLQQEHKLSPLRKPESLQEQELYEGLDERRVMSDAVPVERALEDDIPTMELPDTPRLANATLDFGKIYVLNLETREDRHDEMAFIAAASGLQLEYVAGVNSKTLEKQSLPDVYGTPQVILEPAHLACYRGHANIWRKIIEDGVETALIMEDDIDWDLNIREITPRIKDALGRITGDSNPFSNTLCLSLTFHRRLIVAWDIFYLGTCYEQYFEGEEWDPEHPEGIVVDVPEDKENLYAEMYDWVEELVENYFNDTSPRRVVVKAKNPVCTHGYAVTQRGARKLLLELNEWMPFPVDITMIHYISEGRFKAYSVLPPMLVQWRNTHDPRKNSDIEGGGISLARNWGFLRSARKHLIDWYLLATCDKTN